MRDRARGRVGAAAPLPEPPHVAMLVGEEAVGVIAAVLDVLEAAAVHGAGVAAGPRADEPAHQHLVGVEVTAALRAHGAAAGGRPPAGLPGASAPAAPGREVGRRAGGARAGEGAALAAAKSGAGVEREPPRPPRPGGPPRGGERREPPAP